MKEIFLTQGKVALIDDADFSVVGRYKWSAEKSKSTFYAVAKVKVSGGTRKMRMHRFLLMPEAGMLVDHRDRNGLNNQRHNLRICNSRQNNADRGASGASSYKGVCATTIRRKNKSGEIKEYAYWQASIQVDGKSKIVGRFRTEKEAAAAYNVAATRIYGEFANLNDTT